MNQFRIETKLDQVSGMFYNEFYFPEEASSPLDCTDPVYTTVDLAQLSAAKVIEGVSHLLIM